MYSDLGPNPANYAALTPLRETYERCRRVARDTAVALMPANTPMAGGSR